MTQRDGVTGRDYRLPAGSAFGAHATVSPWPGVESGGVGGAVNRQAEVRNNTVVQGGSGLGW
jgi:hypothetical protein